VRGGICENKSECMSKPFLPMTLPAISFGIHIVKVTSLKKVSGASLLPPLEGPLDTKLLILFIIFASKKSSDQEIKIRVHTH